MTRSAKIRPCSVKAGREAAVLLWLLRHAVTSLLGRTWTGPWAGMVEGAVAEAAAPLSVCSGRVGVWDV